MDVCKKTLQVILIQLPKTNLGWSLRFYSKRCDHVRLSNNITFITSNSQYNPDRSILTAYNNGVNHRNKPPIDPAKKPIVLLYGWLMSQDKFLRKFSDIYTDHGFDVLRVKVKVDEVLWPQSVNGTIKHLRNFMFSHIDNPYIIHGFSVGGFVHTELVRSFLYSEDALSKKAMKQFKGQIFDSVVDMYGVPAGVSASIYLNEPIRQACTRMAIQAYLSLTRKWVYDRYIRTSETFHSNPLLIPSLMFYSKADTIGASGPIEAAINSWRNKGIPVTQRCWETSEHVGHYKADPVEYTRYLNSFLTSLGFIQAPGQADEVTVNSSETPCDAGLRNSDRFRTDIKEGVADGGDGKPIEVMMEVGVGEDKKDTPDLSTTKKVSAANKQA